MFDAVNPRSKKVLILLLFLSALLQCHPSIAHSQSSSRKKPTAVRPQTVQSTLTFDKAVKIGDEFRIARRLEEAIDAYTQALRIRPKWADGWWWLGAIHYEKNRYAEARDAFNNLVSLESNRGRGWGMLGLCQFRTGDYERAIASLERGHVLGFEGKEELNSVVIYHSALLYARSGEFEIAFNVLSRYGGGYENQKILEAFGLIMLRMPFLPDEIPTDKREEVLLAGRAGANMAAGRTADGRKAFEELLMRYPDDPNAHYSFGVFMIPQDIERALQEFRLAIELNPNHQAAMVQMAFEFLKRREYETALPLAEKSVELAPGMYPARNVLGRVLLEVGQTERAIKELEEGVRLAPGSREMHFALARAYARAGRKEEAERETEIFKKLEEKQNQQAAAEQTEGARTKKPAKPNP